MLKLSKKLSEKSPAVLLAVLGLCLGRSCAEHVLSLPSKDASVVVVGRSAVNANGIEFDMPVWCARVCDLCSCLLLVWCE